jgi:hypothetical protein
MSPSVDSDIYGAATKNLKATRIPSGKEAIQ